MSNSSSTINWAMDLAKIGTWHLDLVEKKLSWSTQTYKIHEMDSGSKLDVDKAIDFYHKDHQAIISSAVEELISTGKSFDLHLQIITKKGNPFWVRTMGRRIQEDGKTIAIEGIFQDISKSKALSDSIELALQDQKQYSDLLNETSIIARTDAQGIITFVNDKFCEISKYSRDELLGQDHRILNSGFHPKSFFIELWKTIASGNDWRGQIKNLAKDESYYWVDTIIQPIKDEKGIILSLIHI